MAGGFSNLGSVRFVKIFALLAAVGLSASPTVAQAAEGCPPRDLDCESGDGGVTLTATYMLNLTAGGSGGGSPVAYEYESSTMCGRNSTQPNQDESCTGSLTYCPSVDDPYGPGPAMYVFRRPLSSQGPWSVIGHTCWPKLIPGPTAPTMAMIEAAFHRTPFADPEVSIQPVGGRTLIRLDNWFAMKWSESGYEPEEIDTLNPADWFALGVRIKPIFESMTYDFGDGTSQGPTTSLGGVYPSGDIVKAYEAAGTYGVRATTVLKGEVSLNGSEWIAIPGQADLTGPTTDLEVVTAKNSLYLTGN